MSPSLMETRRLALQDILETIMDGRGPVYFQPPNGAKITYPCIIYNIGGGDSMYADNNNYHFTYQWEIKYLDTKPINDVVKKIMDEFQMVRFNRRYVNDHINHDVIILYY